jgi:hypothetical protein
MTPSAEARASLAQVSSFASGLVPVHVGQPTPGVDPQQAPPVPQDLDWRKHGLQPRWIGMESSDCAAALEPGFFHGRGADERDRFLAGASRRGEVALVVAAIGEANDSSPRNLLSRFDSSVNLSKTFTSVDGRRLPIGTQPMIAPGLSAADRDLAIRLLTRPSEAPWWALHLSGSVMERGDGSGSVTYEAEGQLHPILLDPLGDPVVAAWTPPSEDQRWYIIPDGTHWDNVLGWLVRQALPEYVPGALRRARSSHFLDPELQTTDELTARHALADLDASYAKEKLRLEENLREAETRVSPVRYGLLYGTGKELVDAVAAVLGAAELYCVDLDQELGATRSADLLVISARGSLRRLVEVKSASGAAQEHVVGHLLRHLDTWPQLRPDQPVTGGVLIVNHQHKLHPSERSSAVYSARVR